MILIFPLLLESLSVASPATCIFRNRPEPINEGRWNHEQFGLVCAESVRLCVPSRWTPQGFCDLMENGRTANCPPGPVRWNVSRGDVRHRGGRDCRSAGAAGAYAFCAGGHSL